MDLIVQATVVAIVIVAARGLKGGAAARQLLEECGLKIENVIFQGEIVGVVPKRLCGERERERGKEVWWGECAMRVS